MIAAVLALVLFFSYVLLPGSESPPKSTYSSPASITITEATTATAPTELNGFAVAPEPIPNELLHGATIMPKLGNETIKYPPPPADPSSSPHLLTIRYAQGRARPRRMEAPAHHARAVPDQTDGGRARGAQLLPAPICATLPLVLYPAVLHLAPRHS